ncbi:MAG: hypothetical protein F9K47_08930 [Burkholderiales bacterium]|nr:MAG: hypothetical protein F9K47_08930 [Burkholderiales bacterium]
MACVSTAAIDPASPILCPQCGSSFQCGMSAGQASEPCWCTRLPPLARLEPGAGCLCPKCLDARLAAEARAKEGSAGLC